MNTISAGLGVCLLAGVLAAGCAKEENGVRAAAASPRERFEILIIPEGTTVVASLDTRIATDTSTSGDSFRATTTEPVTVNGRTVIPVGSVIKGVLQDVQASGRAEGRARMTLAYSSLVDVQGKTQTVTALPLTLEAASETRGDLEKIAAGGVIGGVIGAIAGGGEGAAIGAGAGMGAGVILMLATKGDDLELNPGQRLAMHMTRSMSVQVPAK